MRIIRAAEFHEQPWKNGGGTTLEVAISPEGADFDSFDWRVSMARVQGNGPFSRFSSVDRTIAVLEGAGLLLHVSDRGIVRVDRASPAYSFPGELAIESSLIAGPVLDLNVMSRRGRCRHALFHVQAISGFRLTRAGAVTLALIRGASATFDEGRQTLNDGDAVLLREHEPPEAIDFVIDGTADFHIADIWRL
jgi:uncharacterized protein